MASIKNYFLLNAALLTAFTVNARNFFVQQDTINQIADCFENFFAKAEKIPSPEKTFIITKALNLKDNYGKSRETFIRFTALKSI